METPLSAADVAAVTNGNRGYGDGFGYGGGAWIWVILLFVLFGYGNGYGRNGLTQAELQQGFDTQSLLRGQEGIKNGLCDGFYAMNTTMLQGFNGLGTEIANNRFAAQNCCCETQRSIDTVRYENAKNTCDIVRAIEKDGDETRKLIVANKIEELKGKIAEQSQAIQSRDFQLSQLAQNSTLINALRPVPMPAYLTCSPYESNYFATRGYNYGCGCGNFA